MTIGFAYKLTPSLTFAFDYQRIFYNEVKAVANSAGISLSAIPAEKRLGSNDGIGFGWEDMDIVKFGLQWDVNKKLSLRTGISHNTETFESSQVLFNILAPGIIRTHMSFGGTYRPAPNHEINAVYTRAFNSSITGTDPNLQGGDIILNMHQHDFMASYTYRW